MSYRYIRLNSQTAFSPHLPKIPPQSPQASATVPAAFTVDSPSNHTSSSQASATVPTAFTVGSPKVPQRPYFNNPQFVSEKTPF